MSKKAYEKQLTADVKYCKIFKQKGGDINKKHSRMDTNKRNIRKWNY